MTHATVELLMPERAGLLQIIRRIQERVHDAHFDIVPPRSSGYVRTFKVRRAAEWVLHNAGVPQGDRWREARAFYEFGRRRLEWVRDPSWMELISDPRVVIGRIDEFGFAAEDCDGHAGTMATLGLAVRLPMRLVLIDRGGELCHVYAAMATGAPTSRAWLAGDDSAESGLLCLDTGAPDAGWNRHAPADARLVVGALPD